MRKTLWIAALILGTSLIADDAQPPAGWSATSPLAEARTNSCAVRGAGSYVLVAGGTGANGDLASVEIYKSDGTFAPAAPMNAARSRFTCTLLGDGTILAAGGAADGSVETYDPVMDAWTTVPGGEARSGQTATLLGDGRVLLAGGSVNGEASSTLEVFDPLVRTLTRLDATLLQARQDHGASILPDGTVMLVGGRTSAGPLDSVEIFDPVAGTVAAGKSLAVARSSHSVTALDDGHVLAAGGFDGQNELDSAEMFDPGTGLWTMLAVRLNVARREHLALMIPGNGGVLLVGGLNGGQPTSATEIYLPVEGTFVALGPLTKARTGIAGASFDAGSILGVGGNNADGPQAACGVLITPSIQFTTATVHPNETPTATGANFPTNSAVALTLDLQGAVAGSTIASAQTRLITKNVTVGPASSKLPIAGFGPVPVFAAQLADAGQTFRLTAKSGQITATATAPVKIKMTLTPPALQPTFEGLTATFLVQLIGQGTVGTISGTVTANLGGDVRSATVSSANNSLFTSFQKTNLPAGTLNSTFSYSGDAAHEAVSGASSLNVVSRQPTVIIGTTNGVILPITEALGPMVAGVPGVLAATVMVAGPVPNPPTPTGTLTFFDRGAVLGTATLAHEAAAAPGSSSARLTFTPLTTSSLGLTVAYSGDSSYRSVPSGTVATVFVRQAPSTLTVSAPVSFSCGSPASINVTLAFPATLGLLNRNVSLFASSGGAFSSISNLGTATLTPSATGGSATATLSAALGLETTSVSAQFAGDSTIEQSTSNAIPVQAEPAPVTVQLTSNPAGGGVTLSATVVPPATCSRPAATGTIQFLEGTATLAALAIPKPVAPVFSDGSSNTIIPTGSGVSVTLARPPGPHTFVAKYLGDQFHQAATSAPITVTFQ